jgi:hypothetical protein
MDSSPSVVIWRIHRDHHLFCCILEQVGEESFELRLLRGHDVVLSQYFDEPGPLLVRAAQLRAEIDPPLRRGRHAIAV